MKLSPDYEQKRASVAKEEKQKKLTITLTDRPPIKIIEEDWDILVSSKYIPPNVIVREDQLHESMRVVVRKFNDEYGYCIVYAVYKPGIKRQLHDGLPVIRCGEEVTLEGIKHTFDFKYDKVVASIQNVCKTMRERMVEEGLPNSHIFNRLMYECIAQLPATDYTIDC